MTWLERASTSSFTWTTSWSSVPAWHHSSRDLSLVCVIDHSTAVTPLRVGFKPNAVCHFIFSYYARDVSVFITFSQVFFFYQWQGGSNHFILSFYLLVMLLKMSCRFKISCRSILVKVLEGMDIWDKEQSLELLGVIEYRSRCRKNHTKPAVIRGRSSWSSSIWTYSAMECIV